MSTAIGFLGLGKLGLPMAANLVDAGYAVTVHNRTASKADPLIARGAELAARPVDVVTPGGVVASVLWDGAAVESVVTSDGFLEKLGDGVHIVMGTIAPESVKKLAALHAKHGSTYVEAPIFGRPEAAVARQLWIPIAGPKAAKERVRPMIEAMGAQGLFDFGEDVGAATIVKLIGNFLIISAARSLGESLAVADQHGLAVQSVVDMLTQSLFPAPIYQSYGKMIADKKAAVFSQSPIPIKDLGLFESTAQDVRLPTPIAHHLLDLLRANIPPQ
jgi:3-hydroxyisobutyrate dehydrogenase-like beta-hydroxyacid dehydrogenase